MPDVAGKRVLIIGDSLSASTSAPGGVFAAALRAHGATVRVDARVSRSAVNLWNGTNGEDGAAVLAADAAWKPTMVVVFLGTNDIATGVASSAKDEIAFRRIASSFPSADLWAIGPPSFPSRPDLESGAPTVYGTLRRVFGSSHVIDARPLTPAGGRTTDGVHFTTGAAPLGNALAHRFLHTAAWGTALALVTMAVAGWFLLR